MWSRNILLIGLILAGSVALRSRLFSLHGMTRGTSNRALAVALPTPSIVEGVNQQFRSEWAAAQNIRPATQASELALLRRASLALTGSIPSLEEIRKFEALPEGRRLSYWLSGILGDRRYSDYFAERLARAFVGTEDGPFLRFRRRRFVTWLSDELMKNRPYDKIVREMVASQGLWTDRPATNYVTVTFDPEKKVFDPERLAARSARAFLGLRIDCAQCHDHPFQAWKQRDFQGLAAFFGQVEPGFTGIHDANGKFEVTDRKSGKSVTIEPAVPFLPELWTKDGTRREQFARWIVDAKNPHLARATVNRVWALMFGRPLVEPVDDIPLGGDVPPVLDLLAHDFVAQGFNLNQLIRSIALSEVFQLESASDAKDSESQSRAWAAFPMTRLRPEQVAGSLYQAGSIETLDQDSHVLVRLVRSFGQQNFVQRYGDTGQDEFSEGAGTIPQRLLLMNGELVREKTKDGLLNASQRIGIFAPNDRAAVEVAYLSVLTRRPSPEESSHFVKRLENTKKDARRQRMADLFWTLINSTEFSWNH